MLLVRSVIIIVLLGLYASCSGQDVEDYFGKDDQSAVSTRKNQDVAILKQIHRHNEDGSYTYGYEGADGSFKIETKTRSGEVTGKYGYVDDSGKLRVVEYGANKHGFQPSGDGITVPPPTLVQSRPEEKSDSGDVEERLSERPAKPQKPLFQQRKNDNDDDGASPAKWAVRSGDDQSSWSSQKPAAASRQRTLAPLYRPAPAARPKSIPPPSGPEPPSGSYQSVQDFGRGRAADQQHSSYQTYEDHQDDLVTEPQPLYRPAAVKPSRRDGGSAARTSVPSARAVPRQMRTGGILDQLIEQYALPRSGSPVSHSMSFGLDQ